MQRRLKRINLCEGWEKPPGLYPEDYLRAIKEWLEDRQTRARQPFTVEEWYDFGSLWVCWPLPPEYRVHADPPDGEPEPEVILRLRISEEFKLSVSFYPPDHLASDVELDLDIEVELDRRSVERHHRYLFDEMGCGEGFVVVDDLDIFAADSAAFLQEVLSNFGIDLYCPVRSLAAVTASDSPG